jgi:putative transposase
MTVEFKGSYFVRDVTLRGVRWYVAYPISYRQIEEMMGERSVEVDHSTLHRWVLKYVPAFEKASLAPKRPVGRSWRLDETAKRDRNAALRFLRKAIGRHGVPEKITIDKSGANTAAIVSYNADHDTDIEIRRAKYLSNIVEQYHRAIKRRVRAMLRLKAFWSAAIAIASIEIMHMIRKGQLRSTGKLRPAQQFYSLAA